MENHPGKVASPRRKMSEICAVANERGAGQPAKRIIQERLRSPRQSNILLEVRVSAGMALAGIVSRISNR